VNSSGQSIKYLWSCGHTEYDVDLYARSFNSYGFDWSNMIEVTWFILFSWAKANIHMLSFILVVMKLASQPASVLISVSPILGLGEIFIATLDFSHPIHINLSTYLVHCLLLITSSLQSLSLISLITLVLA